MHGSVPSSDGGVWSSDADSGDDYVATMERTFATPFDEFGVFSSAMVACTQKNHLNYSDLLPSLSAIWTL